MKNVKGVWLPDGERHLTGFAKEEGWTYQKHKLDAAVKHVKNFDVAVDIGGHCGLWSMHLTKLFKKVYAFEPIPLHRECFEKNVTGDYELFPYALGEEEKEVHLKWNSESSGDTRVSAPGNDVGFSYFPAEMKTLDSFDLNPDFMKLDCEGFEYFILKGGVKTIALYRPIIIIEQKPGRADFYGVSKTEGVSWLQSRGYKCVDVIAGDYIMVP